MYYKVIKAYDVEELEKKVNMNINAGFVPQGGIAAVIHQKTGFGPTVEYIQAMTSPYFKIEE